MRTYKIVLIILVVLIGLSVFLVFYLQRDRAPVIKKAKPAVIVVQPGQKEILTEKGIDSVLNTLEKVPFEKLGQAYLNFSGYNRMSYRVDMGNKIFYKIDEDDLSKNLVGKFTVVDFMPKDGRFIKSLRPEDRVYPKYLCINKYLLHRFLDLIIALDKKGYEKYAFSINDGFRYPTFNNFTGGASNSEHIYGMAIDLAIGDINKDGNFDEATDKKIVLKLLEDNIIKNSGGVGRYPSSNVVHFDIRGFNKRWDYQ